MHIPEMCLSSTGSINKTQKIQMYSTLLFFFNVWSIFGDLSHPQWMECGMSGPAGVPALPPAPMGPCREPESVTALLTEALNAEESGWRLSTASSGSVQVIKRLIKTFTVWQTFVWCSFTAGSNIHKLGVSRDHIYSKTIKVIWTVNICYRHLRELCRLQHRKLCESCSFSTEILLVWWAIRHYPYVIWSHLQVT